MIADKTGGSGGSATSETSPEMEQEPVSDVNPAEFSEKKVDDLSGLEESVASSSQPEEVKSDSQQPAIEGKESGAEKLKEALRQFYENVQELKRTIEQKMEIVAADGSLEEVKNKAKEQILDWQINEYLGNSDYLDLAIELAFKSVSFAEMQDSLTNDKQYQGLKDYLMGK